MQNAHDFKKFLDGIRVGLLVTHSADGEMSAAPMTLQSVDETGESLWFICNESCSTAQDFQQDPAGLAVFAHPGRNDYASVSIHATIERDPHKIKELWSPATQAWFPDGPEDPNLRLIHAKVRSAEIWDGPSSILAWGLQLTNAAFGNPQPPLMGSHERIVPQSSL